MPLTINEARHQANQMVKQHAAFVYIAEVIAKADEAEKWLASYDKIRDAAQADLAQLEAAKQKAIADAEAAATNAMAVAAAQAKEPLENELKHLHDQIARTRHQCSLDQAKSIAMADAHHKRMAQEDTEFAAKVEEHACLYGAAAGELKELQAQIEAMRTHIEELNQAHEEQKRQFQVDQDKADAQLKKTKLALKKIQQQISVSDE